MIETFCFYAYMLATCLYILWRQCVGSWFKQGDEQSDMVKALNDFIEYAAINLTWFAFNIVLCILPPLCIYFLQNPKLVKDDATGSYSTIMYVLWGMHIIHFVAQMRIYEIKKVDAQQEASGTDDNFTLQADEDRTQATNVVSGDQRSNNPRLESVYRTQDMITFHEHYIPMTREFVMNHVWLWAVNSIVCLSCYIAYAFIDGNQITFALYIPFDLLLNLAKGAFYWWYYYEDQREKAELAEITNYLKNSRSERKRTATSTEPLLTTAADGDQSDESDAQTTLTVARKTVRQVKTEQEHQLEKERRDADYLKKLIESEKKLNLGGDTYAMAFKAFNWKVMRELDLEMDEVHNAYHAAMFVFGIQVLMIYFVGTIIFSDSFQIVLPANTQVMGARFICTILMHL